MVFSVATPLIIVKEYLPQQVTKYFGSSLGPHPVRSQGRENFTDSWMAAMIGTGITEYSAEALLRSDHSSCVGLLGKRNFDHDGQVIQLRLHV
jgi:hypothetical protein